jgi:hypothetical protein
MTPKYEAPTVKMLGTITDLTQSKPGIFFDFPGSSEGNDGKPAPGTPGTVS